MYCAILSARWTEACYTGGREPSLVHLNVCRYSEAIRLHCYKIF